ncbi:MAG TPA: cytochrome c oxidase assembly protein, partial [Steroidobacteraceae bacterium]|nr:cytochrome c oxidase assembly protein [Steroidobacteraceae bacterium]
RGLRLTPLCERPGVARSVAFFAGSTLAYLVLQTKYEYLSTHMFFLHALQQFAVHHLGPFLVALSWPQAVLARAVPLPPRTRSAFAAVGHHPLARALYAALQNRFVAPTIFTGLIVFWLLPGMHFDAMLSGRVYWWMNWSMLVDGLLFWFLALDPRPRGAGALLGYGARMAMVLVMMVPEMLVGVFIALSGRDLYEVYDVCGRAWAMSAQADQELGGLILWVPVATLDAVAVLLLLRLAVRASAASGPIPARSGARA